MYEDNYPNNQNSSVNNNAESGSANNTYHYEGGSAYQSTATGTNQAKAPKPPKKSGNGIGSKLAIGICCGLLFGIFAGIGFQAVKTASDILIDTGHSKIKEEASTYQDKEDKNKDKQNKEEVKQEDSNAEESTDTSIDEDMEALSKALVSKAKTTVTDVTQVVKNVMPAVVSINNKYVEKMSFFGQDYSNEAISSGSGIIVGQNDSELLIVSNYHVVASTDELTVQFVDGSQVQAQIKGTDQDKDLAVVAVSLDDIENETMDNIVVANLGDSDALTVGEPVIAIGNALGYGQSVTTGVVSALNRPIAADIIMGENPQEDTEINTFIQTDAAINPGNSGGALLNIQGEVIGINSNKIGGNAVEGMGYAIPITDAKPIIEKLMTKETRAKVNENNKGYLGITGVDVVAEYSQVYDIPQGVYVSSVIEGSAAEDAGLVKGDIITALNEEDITSMSELKDELAYYTAGTEVTLTIMQGSPDGYQAKDVTVTLGEQSTMN